MALENALIYEQIMNDAESNYRVTIGGLTGGPVSGVLNAPMPIAGGNDYESIRASLTKTPLIGGIAETVFGIGDAISGVMKLGGQDTTQSVEQTRKVWQESKTPQLSIELTFWQVDSAKYESPMNKVNRIYSALFPKKLSNLRVSAPLDYKFVNKNGDAQGVLSLTIGKWFRAGNLVMVDSNFTPSLEVGSDGTPLYFTGTVTLEPYKMITYEDYLGWFRNPTKASGGSSIGSGATDKSKGLLNDLQGSFKKLPF